MMAAPHLCQPRWFRSLWPHAAIGLAWLPLAQVFSNPQLACSDSGLTYLLRAVQLHLNVLGGHPFLSWAPELMHGFGYPVFGFYAPLSTWLIEALHLAGLDFAPATQFAFAGALLAAGLGTQVLIADDFGQVAGVVAGIAFMYAPYILFDAIQRGGLPELMAFAAAPWALWLARRAAAEFASGALRGRALLASLLAVAALVVVVLSHNMVPIWLSPLLVLACWAPGVGPGRQAWRRAGLAIAIVVAAMAVTAFFWLPALAELKWVQSWQALAVHGQDYRNNLLPITQWLTVPPLPVDPTGLLNPPIVRTMSIVAVVAAVGGLLLAFRLPRAQRWSSLVYALMLFLCFGLATEWARGIWDNVPGMKWFQLPTRFLGLASLGAAGLTGAFVCQLGQVRRSAVLLGSGLAAALILNGLPWTYAPYCNTPVNATVHDIAAGTKFPLLMTAEGSLEFLPIWVQKLPDDKPLVAELAANRLPERLDRSLLPAGATAQAQVMGPGSATWEVNSPTSWTALYQSFYFPGWRATLDGQSAIVQVTYPNGLMAVAVPAGRHVLTFHFGATPIHVLAGAVSLAATLGLAGLWMASLLRERSPALTSAQTPNPSGSSPPIASPRTALALLGVLLVLVAIKWTYLDHVPNALRAPRLAEAGLAGVSHPTNLNFSGELEHLGYDMDTDQVTTGGALTVVQYWRALVDIGVPYAMVLRLADDAGHVWSLPAERPFGYTDFPGTESWPQGAYARDAYRLHLVPGTPPGKYWLETSAFRRDIQFTLVPAAGTSVGIDPAWARLGQITVLAATAPTLVPAGQAAVDVHAPVEIGDGLTLVGWTTPLTVLGPGDSAHIQLLWQAHTASGQALAGTGEVKAADGAVVASYPFQLGGEHYPVPLWPTGALVRDQLDWRLPPALRTGTYQLRVMAGAGADVMLGTIHVEAPVRFFKAPAVVAPAPSDMGFAHLVGLLSRIVEVTPGNTLPVDLVWQAIGETDVSYRVFIHLRDSAGHVRAQSDAVPAGWTRPTTGWLAGEYIVDHHDLTLPPDLAPGSYGLFAGLYDPATGDRLGDASLGLVQVK